MLSDVRRILLLAAAGTALLAAPAHAATVAIQLDDTVAVIPHGVTTGGVKLYSAFYANAVVLRGTVRDDNGLVPPAGTIVHLGTITRAGEAAAPLADVLTLADGSFSRTFVPVHSYTLLADVGRPTDPAIAGLSAADAPPIVLGVGPNLQLTTKLVQRGQPYRIRGIVDIPKPRTAGRMLLKRRSPGATKYITIAAQRTRSNGTFSFAVVHKKSGTYRYQLVFVPTDDALWLRSILKLRVKFTKN
jgi:hypothetical protein